MDNNNIVCLTEASFRHLVDEQSFKRGIGYYEAGAVNEAVIRGKYELSGLCSGSRYESYSVKILFDENGIREASCSCPRGGFCKHIVALSLKYINEPYNFTAMPLLEEQLKGFSREELEKLIRDMVQRAPFLAGMVDRRALISTGTGVEKDLLRREAERTLRFSDLYDVEEGLRDLLQTAEEMEEKGNRAGAGVVYQEVFSALTSFYEEDLLDLDIDGDIAVIAGECVEGLCSCLEACKGEKWGDLRQEWLDTLLDAEFEDTAMGGIDFAAGAFDVILKNASDKEWVLLEERLRENILQSKGWGREVLVEMLKMWYVKKDRNHEANEIIREMGSERQIMFLLVQEGKTKEAAAMAKENFTMQPGIILNLTKDLTDKGEAEVAKALLTELLADSKTAQPGYQEWLANQCLAEGNLEAALRWQIEVVMLHPTMKHFEDLHKIAGKLNNWDKVRHHLLSVQEDKKNWEFLLQVALYEDQVDRALELLPLIPYRGWRNYREEVAKASEKKRPLDAAALYREMAEKAIRLKQRTSYQQAASYLSRMKAIYNKIGKVGEWENFISLLKKEYARFPALQDELKKAKL